MQKIKAPAYSYCEQLSLFVKDHIDEQAASRQENTAREILTRLNSQPGLILADEVGMGKTFVALAVAVSTYLSQNKRFPVVIMVPANILGKWQRDFDTFRARCVTDEGIRHQLRRKSAVRAEEFFKCVDDPEDTRPAVVFMTHGAMSRGLTDPWFKLALIQRALKGRHGADDVYRAFSRFGPELLELKSASYLIPDSEDFWYRLLTSPSGTWTKRVQKIEGLWERAVGTDLDDLVPLQVQQALDEMTGADLLEIYHALYNNLPRKEVGDMRGKLLEARSSLRAPLQRLWKTLVRKMQISGPLLVMDEAHHLKNARTRISGLFASEASASDAESTSKGELSGVFDRMCFLTATPFQLGHSELVSVLQRFCGIRWESPGLAYRQPEYEAKLAELSGALTGAQIAGTKLDREWGRFHRSALTGFSDESEWWASLNSKTERPENEELLFRVYLEAKGKMKAAEEKLRPWVIRHLRPKMISLKFHKMPRRKQFEGAGIIDERPGNKGIEIDNSALLPFLLASRAAIATGEARPVFAEGLASSYEAFVDTRKRAAEKGGPIDQDDVAPEQLAETDELKFYLSRIEECLSRKGAYFEGSHPKIERTVTRAVELWGEGEKVLVFCHYIKTGRVLRQKISEAIRRKTDQLAAARLEVLPSAAAKALESIGNSMAKREDLLRHLVTEQLKGDDLQKALGRHEQQLFEVVRKLVRTPSFLVRYFPLEKYKAKGEVTKELAEEAVMATDKSGIVFRDTIHKFFKFLAVRCEDSVQDAYLDALTSIQTGSLSGHDVSAGFGADENHDTGSSELMANVRLANGEINDTTRARLMLGFNTPFFPEILIASSVMAEGVDLHLNCRYIIHHDLSWNPSSLEQRTGRLDRIGAKVEGCGQSIHVYLPYLAGTQDEKMFRVVMDRDRWFKVLMGDNYSVENIDASDLLTERIPLPLALAEELAFNLAVADSY